MRHPEVEAIAPTLSAEKNEGLAATAQHGERRPSGEIREPTQDAGRLQEGAPSCGGSLSRGP